MSQTSLVFTVGDLIFLKWCIILGKVLKETKYSLISTCTYSWEIQCIFSIMWKIHIYTENKVIFNIWQHIWEPCGRILCFAGLSRVVFNSSAPAHQISPAPPPPTLWHLKTPCRLPKAPKGVIPISAKKLWQAKLLNHRPNLNKMWGAQVPDGYLVQFLFWRHSCMDPLSENERSHELRFHNLCGWFHASLLVLSCCKSEKWLVLWDALPMTFFWQKRPRGSGWAGEPRPPGCHAHVFRLVSSGVLRSF